MNVFKLINSDLERQLLDLDLIRVMGKELIEDLEVTQRHKLQHTNVKATHANLLYV
jgi:hypothetical protein